MKKSRLVTLTFTFAALVVLVGFSIREHRQSARYQRLLEQTYTHAFTELTSAASELSTALTKVVYTTPGPLQTSLYQQIYAKALAAQTALGQLPYGNLRLEQTASFFAKTGDYALALTRSTIDGSAATLTGLSDVATPLSETLSALQLELENGNATFSEWEDAVAALSAVEETADLTAAADLQTMESEFPELPSLVYDGPFSEHLADQAPRMLENQPTFTQEELLQKAAAFLQADPAALTAVSTSAGQVPTASFTLPMEGGLGYIELTCQGGQVLSYFLDRSVKAETITESDAILLAENYLVSWGFPRMEHSYTIRRSGRLTIHFAPVSNDVFCYPDLIKLTLALDDGTLLGYEATGYLTHHTQRSFPAPAVTLAEAATALPGGVTVLSSQLALIPTSGGTEEVLTYEFKTENSQGQHILFYINAETGLQQNILLLLEDESGTLAL